MIRSKREVDERQAAAYPCDAPSQAETDAGLFERGSMLRQIMQESVGLLGGGRSLLMQLAHPLVAAAVVEHSDFHADPLGRLANTLDLMLTIGFGSRAQAQQSLRSFHASHAHVAGQLAYASGPFPAGAPYDGRDPQLKLWVHATLVDTAFITYERFVSPLSDLQRARFYQDSKCLAGYFGIPTSLVPPTLDNFHQYVRDILASGHLCVSAAARSLAITTVFAPNVWLMARLSATLIRFVTVGLLPESLREAYGFSWTSRQDAALNAVSHFSRAVLPFLPAWLRYTRLNEGGLVNFVVRGGRRKREHH